MKKIATLLLAAGLVFGAATGASAIDFKAKGQWLMSFDYGQNGGFTGGKGMTGFNWWREAPVPYLNFFFWALLCPAAYSILQRWPFSTRPILRTSGIHLGLALLTASVHELSTSAIYYAFLQAIGEFDLRDAYYLLIFSYATDALTITKGGFLVGTFGIEDKLARFAKAYRALPAVKFEDIAGLADPVRVRQKVVDGANYVYVLNRLPYPVTVELALEGGAAEDLVSGETSTGGKLALALRPYDLRSFRQAGTRGRVTGGSAAVAEEVAAGLRDKVAAADAQFRDKTARGEDLAALKPSLEKAKACLAGKEYARLHLLLQEAWAYTLRQP